MVRTEIFLLPGIEPLPFSLKPVATPTELLLVILSVQFDVQVLNTVKLYDNKER
jgi:hypothetical protein